MNDDQLLQYSRQIMLPAVDIEGQEKLLAATVLIVGLGGLGCPAALYLAAAGVGTLLLVDFDEVELSNLQRQIAHGYGDLGKNKATSAQASLLDINPGIEIQTITKKLEGPGLQDAVQSVDLVIDCSDRFSTRFALNEACFQYGKPLISGAAIALEGQLTVFDPANSDSPCYRCIYSDADDEQLSCSENGVISPLTGIIGSMQALEAVKLIVGFGQSLVGCLLMFDASQVQFHTLTVSRKDDCPVCSARRSGVS